MFRRQNGLITLATTICVAVVGSVAFAQDGSSTDQDAAPSAQAGQQSSSSPAPPQSNQQSSPTSDQSQSNQNSRYELSPPMVGLNVPALEPSGMESRSFLIPGAQLSQAAQTGEGDVSNNTDLQSVTRALGSVTLQKLWRRYDFALDYLGGVGYYSNRSNSTASLQLMDVDQHVNWSRGQFAIRDAFSYLPEGNFGAGSFGGTGALESLGGFGGLMGLGIIGPGQLATIGEQPRVTDLAIADVTEFLTPRSSISAVGSYGFVHFTDDTFGLVNSHQFVGQAAYDYQLTRKDQVAVLYAHQAFRFPSGVGDDINTNLVNVLFGRRVSGRMDLVLGGGPQFTHIMNPKFASIDTQTFSGRASLTYHFAKQNLALLFFRYNTNGSGLLAGATTDVIRCSYFRSLGERWNVSADVGYSHNHRITPSIFINNVQSLDYEYAGPTLHRQLSREFSAFVSYQFNDVNSDATLCVGPTCARSRQRETALIGLDWHPHAIGLD